MPFSSGRSETKTCFAVATLARLFRPAGGQRSTFSQCGTSAGQMTHEQDGGRDLSQPREAEERLTSDSLSRLPVFLCFCSASCCQPLERSRMRAGSPVMSPRASCCRLTSRNRPTDAAGTEALRPCRRHGDEAPSAQIRLVFVEYFSEIVFKREASCGARWASRLMLISSVRCKVTLCSQTAFYAEGLKPQHFVYLL